MEFLKCPVHTQETIFFDVLQGRVLYPQNSYPKWVQHATVQTPYGQDEDYYFASQTSVQMYNGAWNMWSLLTDVALREREEFHRSVKCCQICDSN